MAEMRDVSNVRSVLANSAHFRDLPRDTLAHMASAARIHTLVGGELVPFRHGEPCFSIILSGAVQVSLASESGHALPIAVLGQGSFIGLNALFATSFAEAKEHRALGPTTLATLASDALRRLMDGDSGFRAHCVKLLMSRLAASLSTLADTIHAPLSQRLARRLLGQALAAGEGERGKAIDITVSQRLVAQMLGASRSTVSEELRRLERAGIVQRRYRALRIIDMERLRQVAGRGVKAI